MQSRFTGTMWRYAVKTYSDGRWQAKLFTNSKREALSVARYWAREYGILRKVTRTGRALVWNDNSGDSDSVIMEG